MHLTLLWWRRKTSRMSWLLIIAKTTLLIIVGWSLHNVDLLRLSLLHHYHHQRNHYCHICVINKHSTQPKWLNHMQLDRTQWLIIIIINLIIIIVVIISIFGAKGKCNEQKRVRVNLTSVTRSDIGLQSKMFNKKVKESEGKQIKGKILCTNSTCQLNAKMRLI